MGSLLLNAEMASFGSEPAFPRRGGVLYAEQVPLPAIAAAVGTPTYVYSANTIRARWQRLDQAFASVPHRIHFAMKAKPMESGLLKTVSQQRLLVTTVHSMDSST